MSDSDSPSTSPLSSAVMMSSSGLLRRCSASCWAYMNISTWAWNTSSSVTEYSGSSEPIMRLLHSKILWRSSLGTPMSSAITSSGSSAATSTTKSISSPFATAGVEHLIGELTDVRFELADHPGGEAAVHELAVPGVVRRVHEQHEVAAGALRLARATHALLEADDPAPCRLGGERARIPVARDDVGVLADHPEAGPVGLGVLVDGRVGAQVREPLVGDALREAVAVEQVDVGELHVVSP